MTLQISPMHIGDQASLVAAINIICAESRWMATTQFGPTSSWRHALGDPDCERHVLLAAREANRVVGWCRIFPTDCQRSTEAAELGIGLLKEYRGQGWGTELLCSALAIATQIGLNCILLSVHPANLVARHLFTRYGFRDVRIGSDHFAHMTLRLARGQIHESRPLLRWVLCDTIRAGG